MKRKYPLLICVIIALSVTGCIKETYDMNKLSGKMNFSPAMALPAFKGNISLSDILKASDTVVYDQDKVVKIVFKLDPVLDFSITDFLSSKSMNDMKKSSEVQYEYPLFNSLIGDDPEPLGQKIATIEEDTIDLGKIFNKITGTINFLNPSIRFKYTNSFTSQIDIDLNVRGTRDAKSVDLNLAPFSLAHPAAITDPEVNSSFTIDRNNSSLPSLMSLPPEKIYFSGSAIMTTTTKNEQVENSLLGTNSLKGSLEVEIPLELRISNLQFADTTNNFLKDDGGDGNSLNPEDFETLRFDIKAKNGFPLGVSLKMILYNSVNDKVMFTVDATNIFEAAPVDSNGRVVQNDIKETSTSIPFTKDFFSSVNMADKIIFQFSLVTTDGGSKDVKIYSDYGIDFRTAVVLKSNINL